MASEQSPDSQTKTGAQTKSPSEFSATSYNQPAISAQDSRKQETDGPKVATYKEQEVPHEEEVPSGWTRMRSMKMRGMGKKGEGSVRLGSSNSGGNAIQDTTGTNGRVGGSSDNKGPGEIEGLTEIRSDEDLLPEERRNPDGPGREELAQREGEGIKYKVYKRRWFGLVQLVLLNIIVSWDWLSFSANSTTTSQYYAVSPSAINWLSTAFLFAFVAVCPLTIWILHHWGPKASIIIASVLILFGNWIRYGATRSGPHGNFGGVMFGQILTGLAQPFVLSAPTRYSDLWFTNSGRVAATAVMSLANPFGGALAQLIDPSWAGKAGDIPNMVLYIAIISSIATIPSFFIPSHPPTPASHSSTHTKQPLLSSLRVLFSSPEFYMIAIPFFIYVALFNSVSSLINQILQPYSFSETNAGIAGALLIVVGLVASAITSPIIDRTKTYLLAIKVCVPIIAACYLAFVWAPQTRSLAAPFVLLSVLGAASFSLVPVVLEYLIEITHPISPEITSTICWSGGQLLGGIFILISDALRAPGATDGSGDDGSTRPQGNMYRTLVFQACVACVVVPLPLCLGLFGRGSWTSMRRVEADRTHMREGNNVTEGEGSVVLP